MLKLPLAQLDQVSKMAHDAADSSDRYVIFVMMGIGFFALTIVIITLYKAFLKQIEAQAKMADAHAQFVMTVYTEGVKSQAILNVTVQDCTECLGKVKNQLEITQKCFERIQDKHNL